MCGGWTAPAPGDPLDAGAQRLAAGSAALRALGYRRVLLAGDSRGAFPRFAPWLYRA